jgi:hypothetical protein
MNCAYALIFVAGRLLRWQSTLHVANMPTLDDLREEHVLHLIGRGRSAEDDVDRRKLSRYS